MKFDQVLGVMTSGWLSLVWGAGVCADHGTWCSITGVLQDLEGLEKMRGLAQGT